ncbi:MAG: hypothetical protein ABI823_05315 [Bryobacteraceae bacterium]
MFRLAAWLLAATSIPLFAQLECKCDVSHPEVLKARECSLCAEIEKQPAGVPVIFLKDINPRKANRWLALPRAHSTGRHNLEDLAAEQRNALWSGAVEKAKSLWGDRWAIAMNGHRVRTQCHMHVHIGRLLEGVETANFVVVDSTAKIPLPGDFGLWIHPVLDGPEKGKLHVHLGEQVTETVLLR